MLEGKKGEITCFFLFLFFFFVVVERPSLFHGMEWTGTKRTGTDRNTSLLHGTDPERTVQIAR